MNCWNYFWRVNDGIITIAHLLTIDNLRENNLMNELINIYINHGISLFEKGENTVIIPINLSIGIVDIVGGLNLFILGGDIHRKHDNKFEHTYDSWYYEGNIQSESITKAKTYLDTLKNQNLYVSFVIK